MWTSVQPTHLGSGSVPCLNTSACLSPVCARTWSPGLQSCNGLQSWQGYSFLGVLMKGGHISAVFSRDNSHGKNILLATMFWLNRGGGGGGG